MKDLKCVSLALVIAVASAALGFLGATTISGRRAAILEARVQAIEARWETELAANAKRVAEDTKTAANEAAGIPPVVYPDAATWEALKERARESHSLLNSPIDLPQLDDAPRRPIPPARAFLLTQ